MLVLGISGTFSPGSAQPAAALVRDGRVIAACEEERFCRVKDVLGILPDRAISWVLSHAGVTVEELDAVTCAVATYDGFETMVKRHFRLVHGACPKRLVPVDHHLAHAASAFYGSGWDEAAVLTYDYSGDGVCAGLYHGRDGRVDTLEVQRTVDGNSLGKFYAALTQFLGFGRGDEYKVMGLSAYWDRGDLYDMTPLIETGDDWFEIRQDAYTALALSSPHQHLFDEKYLERHYFAPRRPGEPFEDRHMRFAASLQDAFERAAMALARRLKAKTGADRIAMAGGCALNGVFNGRLSASGLYSQAYTPPVSGDAGGAVGSAFIYCAREGVAPAAIESALLGPQYSPDDVRHWLDILKVDYQEPNDLCGHAARDIASGKLVGWFQGRTEYGPRALGARSILADPAHPHMRDAINRRVKFRETFRPFAPSVLAESAERHFHMHGESPFMNFVFPVRDRQEMPAVTHVDGSARVQTVAGVQGNELYRDLIRNVGSITGRDVVLNTSFNINGQPIVNTPHEAVYTFNASGLDVLYVGPFRVHKHR